MELNNRKSIRLSGYDYSNNGYYFVTICTHNRQNIFGNISYNNMILNNLGVIVESVLKTLPNHHPVNLNIFQIMPNHIHFILQIARNQTGIARNAPTKYDHTEFGHVVTGSLSSVIRSFKSETTKQIRILSKNKYLLIWQRNYYEHIIRNDQELNKIREYIKSNPLMWKKDRNNPASLGI